MEIVEDTSRETASDGRIGVARRRTARALLVAERVLVLVGVVCLAAWASACATRSLYQATEQQHFDDEIRRVLVMQQPDQSEWSASRVSAFAERPAPDPGEALGRLDIPGAGVSVMVLEGDDDATLDRAVGRIPGTARVGESGNLGIAGHRDGFFRGLRHLSHGDEMTLATLDGLTRYRVSDIKIVEPEDVTVLDPTPEPTITLVTCYPFYYVGSAPHRYIVRGERVAFEPWTSERVAQFLGNDLARR